MKTEDKDQQQNSKEEKTKNISEVTNPKEINTNIGGKARNEETQKDSTSPFQSKNEISRTFYHKNDKK